MLQHFHKTPDQQRAVTLLGGQARNILLYGGSRSGKTFIALYAVLYRALNAPGSRHAILRLRANAIRHSVVNDTLPRVVKLCFPKLHYKLNRTDMFIALPNGSEIWFGGLDSADRAEKILGREFATVYFNECSEIGYDAVLLALTRLAQRTRLRTRAYYDCNPSGTRHWTYKLFVQKLDPVSGRLLKLPRLYAAMQMNPSGNAANLPSGYISETLAALSARQRRRFLEGQFQPENDNALWNNDLIDRFRTDAAPEDLARVVVGVDPAVTSSGSSDLTGIVVCARAGDGHFYVLADRSLKASPLGWAGAVCAAYADFDADAVVGECNNGGDLIEMALRSVDARLPFRRVTATRGKYLRAEPVAALYERGMVHHAGRFDELERQMCEYTPLADYSPDRLDALVWAIHELMLGGAAEPRCITA